MTGILIVFGIAAIPVLYLVIKKIRYVLYIGWRKRILRAQRIKWAEREVEREREISERFSNFGKTSS